jgi:hypothetical protein
VGKSEDDAVILFSKRNPEVVVANDPETKHMVFPKHEFIEVGRE